ncbi:MAG: NAD(P)/FAD-dependent oxidoreductase [Rhodospirillales bacterium]|nr:NAD(P)/FAD-dependent oxidoreductase [Rhodospirillales bacterium]
MRRPRLVLVGNGMAGMRAIEEILDRAPDRFAITVFGAEPHGAYNRILLSPVLAGEKRFADILTHDRAWYAARGIELITGEAVVAIDRAARRVRGAAGTERGYDVLLLATGSTPLMLDLPGAGLPGVRGFRDIADVEAMLAGGARRAVVIGGGLLGLEAAHGLARRGMAVSVVHLMASLMERQLDPLSAGLLRADLVARGIEVHTAATTRAILGDDQVRAVELACGTTIPADLVVMAAGIRPAVALARAAGLACGRGITVDDALRTSDAAIFAVGECAEHRGQVFGLVAPLWEMARIAAGHIAGQETSAFAAAPPATRLKVSGIDMFSAGDFADGAGREVLTFQDRARGIHKRLVLHADRLIGAVLYGDAGDGAWYDSLITAADTIAARRDLLLFGPAMARAA